MPCLGAGARGGYYKVNRKPGEFAQAIGAVLHDPERGLCRAVAGATESRPIVIEDAGPLLENYGRAAVFDPVMVRLRQAFTEEHALQCGYCTPGHVDRGP